MRRPVIFVALLALAPIARAEVRIGPGGVHIESRGQLLSELLGQLARSGGFEVKYDGATPGTRVYALVESPSVPEAIGRLLAGVGITWGARFDPSGQKLELLFIGAPIQTGPATASPIRPSRPEPPPPPDPVEEDPEPPMEQHPEESPPPPPVMAAPPGAMPPGAMPPGAGAPNAAPESAAPTSSFGGSSGWSPSPFPSSGLGWSTPPPGMGQPTPAPATP